MSALIISLAVTVQGSLADASSTEVLSPALNWIEATIFGSVATGIAVIAIASIGFGMLSGRLSLRRGFTILMGCFILFGASNLSRGLRAFAEPKAQSYATARQTRAPIFTKPNVSSQKGNQNSYDPYAGAAVQR